MAQKGRGYPRGNIQKQRENKAEASRNRMSENREYSGSTFSRTDIDEGYLDDIKASLTEAQESSKYQVRPESRNSFNAGQVPTEKRKGFVYQIKENVLVIAGTLGAVSILFVIAGYFFTAHHDLERVKEDIGRHEGDIKDANGKIQELKEDAISMKKDINYLGESHKDIKLEIKEIATNKAEQPQTRTNLNYVESKKPDDVAGEAR